MTKQDLKNDINLLRRDFEKIYAAETTEELETMCHIAHIRLDRIKSFKEKEIELGLQKKHPFFFNPKEAEIEVIFEK